MSNVNRRSDQMTISLHLELPFPFFPILSTSTLRGSSCYRYTPSVVLNRGQREEGKERSKTVKTVGQPGSRLGFSGTGTEPDFRTEYRYLGGGTGVVPWVKEPPLSRITLVSSCLKPRSGGNG